ncbi:MULTISPECIES: DUF1835 domain-containing protein [unclassified Algibacter]|uniref:DUF1835 domain-containing protein n=1 Tax=unclassified Algibacter TaxID=2615009 RepID=UPI00131E2F18|nr:MULTISPECIES: DUF1835 domain-containing protein [unclassified Algibacter]MCL5128037.1 DUF1835 domain-containing protein [Algibacter sp. L4_22]
MSKKILHITNGGRVTSRLNELKIEGERFTLQEMFCEGPTVEQIRNQEFIDLRSKFFNDFYDIDLDLKKVNTEIKKLNDANDKYSHIVLWFGYDLFCHINMITAINLLHQEKIKLPIYLVCSGRIKGSKNLQNLAEISKEQFLSHYENKVLLKPEDIDFVTSVWGIYCGKDHNLLKPYIVKPSNFAYLSNCLKAHLERFPDSVDGLNILERNILLIVNNNTIKSKHHLLGYALNYQGYYGYAELQLTRIIEKLNIFFTEEENSLTLNTKGHEALLGKHNFSAELNNQMIYGGIKKHDFEFDKKLNKLIKTV